MRLSGIVLLVLFLTGCGVPNTHYRLTNRSLEAIEISAIRKDGKSKRLGIINPGNTGKIGRARTLVIKNDHKHVFRLPGHVTKWAPRELRNGQFKYDLSDQTGDGLVWTDNPPLLHASGSFRAVAVPGGDVIKLPIISLGFPLVPMTKSQTAAGADDFYRRQKRKDIFTVGRQIESGIARNPAGKSIFEPINWPFLETSFAD